MRSEWKRALRTGVQVALSLLLVSPAILPALGLNASLGVGAIVAGLSALLSRLMSIPQLVPFFRKIGLHADGSL